MSLELISKAGIYQTIQEMPLRPDQEKDVSFSDMAMAIPRGGKRMWDIFSEGLSESAGPYVEDAAAYWFGDESAARQAITDEREKAREIIRQGNSTAQEMDAVSRFLYTGTEIIGSALVGGVVAGPVGAMAAAGAVTGRERYIEVTGQGVDADTAFDTSLVAGVTMAAAVAAPAYLGVKLATQIATGVGMNVVAGGADRYGTHKILADAGYNEVAKHYDVLDGNAIMADAILGAMFPIAGKAAGALRNKILNTNDADAALRAKIHAAENESLPVLPKDAAEMEVMQKTMDSAREQILAEGKTIHDMETSPLPEGPVNTRLIEEQRIMESSANDVEAEIMRDLGLEDLRRVADELDAAPVTRELEEVGKPVESTPPREGESKIDAFLEDDFRKLKNRDLQVRDVIGELKSMDDAMRSAEIYEKELKIDSTLHNVAIACALRNGH